MRFGKTFTTYQLAREMGWTRVLVLTYKPAVQTAWRDDLLGHVDFAGWQFVDRDTPIDEPTQLLDGPAPLVWFASFQDLRQDRRRADQGAQRGDPPHRLGLHRPRRVPLRRLARQRPRPLRPDATRTLAEIEEPEEEVTEEDLGLDSAHYLYLSGTPFRAITNGEFTEDQIFNWTYVDEQAAKDDWTTPTAQTPTSSCRGWRCTAYEIGDGGRRAGRRTASSRASP